MILQTDSAHSTMVTAQQTVAPTVYLGRATVQEVRKSTQVNVSVEPTCLIVSGNALLVLSAGDTLYADATQGLVLGTDNFTSCPHLPDVPTFHTDFYGGYIYQGDTVR